MSLWSILVFPALFTGRHVARRYTDSIFMLKAYGLAFVNRPEAYDKSTMTFVSVLVAVMSSVAWKPLIFSREKLSLRGLFGSRLGG